MIGKEEFGGRRRTFDEADFTVTTWSSTATFRAQLFTGPGRRPVAVLTQTNLEPGASFINPAEEYTEEVWRRCCPQESRPPIVVAHMLMGAGTPEESSLGLRLIDFTVTGPHAVGRPPLWGPALTPEDLTSLIGCPVDISRGPFTPAIYPPDPVVSFVPALVALLPNPDLHDDPLWCMRQVLHWPQRITRQLHGHHEDQGCCWYHGGDWHRVCREAVTALRAAGRGKHVLADAVREHVSEHVPARPLSRWERDAFTSLFFDPIDVDKEIGYVNGRHRSRALLAAGVFRAPIVRLTWPKGTA